MTVPQKKYFCNRIDEIRARKENEIWNKMEADANEPAVCLSGISEGKVRIITRNQLEKLVKSSLKGNGTPRYSSTYMPNIDIEKLMIGWESYKQRNAYTSATKRKEVDDSIEKLREEATKIKDIAMFGNSAEAHIMLQEFIKWM